MRLDFQTYIKHGKRVAKVLRSRVTTSTECNADFTRLERIGSNSKVGKVYKVIDADGNEAVAKRQKRTDSAVREAAICELLAVRALAGNFHFPISYGSTVCGKDTLVTFAELMDGDIPAWMRTRNMPAKAYGSAAGQILVAFAHFHALGFAHCDSHWGQVLYKRIKPGGVWHYKICGSDVYISNCGYLFKIWDFGKSRPIGHCSASSMYSRTSENVYHVMTPFFATEEVRANGLNSADDTTVDTTRLIGDILKKNNIDGRTLLKKYTDLLLRLPGVTATVSRSTAVLNTRPLVL